MHGTDFLDRIEARLASDENLTQESVESAFDEFLAPYSESIVAFTGYYSMAAAPGGTGIEPGAFLSIDTTEAYFQLTEKIVLRFPFVTVTVSKDGQTSQTYSLDRTTTFDGQTLTIPNVLSITLTRGFDAGVLVTFQGVLYGAASIDVVGSTRFNPITLPTFIGKYYAGSGSSQTQVLSISDTTLGFNSGSGMNTIRLYTYTPLMFVLQFTDPATRGKCVLMLGTAAGLGLACYVQQGTGGFYAFTIPPQA